MTTASERVSDLTAPYREIFKRPFHAEWAAKGAKAVHGELQNRLCQVLDRENADFALKMIYAAPIFLANHMLFTTVQAAVANTLAVGYIWSAGKHVMEERTKVNLLHSIALAAFSNLNPLALVGLGDALIKGPSSLFVASAAIIAASQADVLLEEEDGNREKTTAPDQIS